MSKRAPWTREEIIEAIQRWAKAHDGQPPAATDFHPSDCRRSARISAARSAAWLTRAAEAESGDYPWPRTVQRVFGRWSVAVRAAGFTPRKESVPDTELSRRRPPISRIRQQIDRAENATGEERRQHLFRVAEMALAAAEE